MGFIVIPASDADASTISATRFRVRDVRHETVTPLALSTFCHGETVTATTVGGPETSGNVGLQPLGDLGNRRPTYWSGRKEYVHRVCSQLVRPSPYLRPRNSGRTYLQHGRGQAD